MSLEWIQDANCTTEDPEIFFAAQGDFLTTREAKKVCGACPVIGSCLMHALNDPSLYGVWGGTTRQERYAIRGAA